MQEAGKGCVRAHLSRLQMEVTWRDLIGQLECELEVLIGWKSHALARTHMFAHAYTVKHYREFINIYLVLARDSLCVLKT